MYQIYGGKCNGQKFPGCLTEYPTFSWKLKTDKKNASQSAYEITVYLKNGCKVYDSGYIQSSETHGISYQGATLESGKDYYWTVKSYSNRGDIAAGGFYFFSMGLLDVSEWKAQWIEPDIPRRPCQDDTESRKIFTGEMPYLDRPEEVLNPCVYFRKQIRISKSISSARMFITAHGIYELFLNGTPYGIPFAPGFTVYKKYQEYQAYDVTESIREGANVIGAIVADGWYLGKVGLMGVGNQYGSSLALLFQLHVVYEDGTKEVFISDEDCRAETGAFRYADLYVGEQYDAEKERKGWERTDYDDSDWKHVLKRDYGYGHLAGSADEPVEILRVKSPERIFYSPKGELLVDAGENISGYISIAGRLGNRQKVKLEYCEVLDQDGNFLRNILGQNKNQTDEYISDYEGDFFYKPVFTYHGFQYVRITGIRQSDIKDIKVYVLGSNLEQTGTFSCSNNLLNLLQESIFRSQQGNMLSIPTDCPQREKAGWTGDMQVYAPTAAFLMDIEAFLRKWLTNMRLEQREDGQIPHVIPDIPSNRLISHGYPEICSSGWADACVIVPYVLYEVYGDSRILSENYEMMQKWMKYVEQKAASEVPDQQYSEESLKHQKYLWNTGFHYGDWLIPSLSKEGVSKKPIEGAEMTKELSAPAMFAYTTSLMSKIAEILGKKQESDYYAHLNQNIKTAYTHEYLREDDTLKLNYQGIYVLALQMKLVPEEKRAKLTDHLVELIQQNNGCLDTGFLSMPFLLDVLYDNGRKEEAYNLLYQEKCPSWLYEIRQGANTIWESWTNITEDGKKNSSSYNHFAFGCVGDFIYRRILGIQRTEPGYDRITVNPDFGCRLDWAKGSYQSIHGEIAVSWAKNESMTIMDVVIPPNVAADIIWNDEKVTVGSGSYHFERKVKLIK